MQLVQVNGATPAEGKRVALFMRRFAGGGVERNRLNLTQGLLDQGVPVDLVVLEAKGPLLEQVPQDARVIDLGSARFWPSVHALMRYLRRERPDVLVSSSEPCNLRAILAKQLAQVSTRVFITTHSALSRRIELGATAGTKLKRSALPWLLRALYPRADGILAVCQGLADDVVRVTGTDHGRVKAIYNPAFTDKIPILVTEKPSHPWLEKKDCPIVLGVGRLTKQKDFATLLRGFAIVRKTQYSRLILVGEGEDRSSLEVLARALDIDDSVSMPGFVTNPYSYMARADLLVMSSIWEGFGNVLVEAMACGCPIVSTDCPSGPREILEDGKHGRLVPVGDHEALARAMLDALNDPPDPHALQLRAMDFHVDTAVQKYREALEV